MDLTDVKIAIIVTDYFEETELTEPRKALEEAGAEVTVIAPLESDIQGVNGHEDGQMLPVDITLEDADPSDYDALLIPGGVGNADALRTNEKAQAFARAMDSDDKPIGVLCHGSWLLIEAGLVDGRSMTSFHSIATDLRNAGAEWQDAEVVIDGNWVSSRKPDDIPAFNAAFIELITGEDDDDEA